MTDKNIFIYGVPGSGKTTVAEALEHELNLPNLELDALRTKVQQGKTLESDPFLFEYTTTAGKHFGSTVTLESAVKGLKAIRTALMPSVTQALHTYKEPILAEAAFLDPNKLITDGLCFLISSPDEQQHYNQFFAHRTKGEEADKQFEAARLINSYLIKEASDLGIPVINNTRNINDTVQQIITLIKTKYQAFNLRKPVGKP